MRITAIKPFQSTSPVWRTTRNRQHIRGRSIISIHVPRVEDDSGRNIAFALRCDFNPRPPCGGRLFTLRRQNQIFVFQSTSPVWRTTVRVKLPTAGAIHFNPRPPCGGRLKGRGHKCGREYFNPRPPCGGRRNRLSASTASQDISIHVPRVEDDAQQYSSYRAREYFNPRPPCGGRR